MKRFILASLSASLLAAAASAAPAPADGIVVMTQNQYIGADVFPLIPAYAQGQQAFNAAVQAVVRTMAHNRTVARVDALAGEILRRNPHLVGVQEAWQVVCEPADAPPCTDADFVAAWGDHLTQMDAALAGRYTLVGYVENFKIDIPFWDSNFAFGLAHVIDRDAIYRRNDVSASIVAPAAYGCTSISVNGCNYDAGLPVPFDPPAPAQIVRGFLMADATVNGKAYRFVNTHLENGYADGLPGVVQSAQAMQLLATLAATTPPGKRLIVVGDMNSAPTDAVDPTSLIPATPYMLFTYGIPDLDVPGLYDAWLYRPGDVAGLSCCQLEDLSNRVSILSRRIDLVLSGQVPLQVKDARLIGEVAADRLWPPGRGLWPSDHAAVAAGLGF